MTAPAPAVLCPILVGRDAEIDRLRAGLDAATAGAGGVVFLVGEAGMGKTRLVRALRQDAEERGMVVLAGAVVRLLPVLGRDRGCVLVLEDLHWADAETLAVVDYLVDALADQPLLCVCPTRLEGHAADLVGRMAGREGAAVVTLDRLG